jgi:hypothetical protein
MSAMELLENIEKFALAHGVELDDEATHGAPISDVIAAKYALYAMLSANAYHKEDRKEQKEKHVRFPVEKLGWSLVGVNGEPTQKSTGNFKSGFAYDIYRKGDHAVFAFRGTDSPWDYIMANLAIPPFHKQYRASRNEFERFKETSKSLGVNRLEATGHSLGGGLALGVSLWFGVSAVTFDPSPRVFDGWPDHKEPAERVAIYQNLEALQPVRARAKKFKGAVKPENIYQCDFAFPKHVMAHSGEYLALGLLCLAARSDNTFTPLVDALKSQHGDAIAAILKC